MLYVTLDLVVIPPVFVQRFQHNRAKNKGRPRTSKYRKLWGRWRTLCIRPRLIIIWTKYFVIVNYNYYRLVRSYRVSFASFSCFFKFSVSLALFRFDVQVLGTSVELYEWNTQCCFWNESDHVCATSRKEKSRKMEWQSPCGGMHIYLYRRHTAFAYRKVW